MRRRYGATPVHLLAHLAAFALAGWAVLQLLDARGLLDVALWFAGAIVLHDLVLLPLYGALDRAVQRGAGSAVNHLRVPLVLSGTLALCYLPVILERGESAFTRVSGLRFDGYLERWMLVSAALFAGSLALWAVRGRRAGRLARP